MSYLIKNGQTSVCLRFKLLDSSSTAGAGLTGLTNASSGLIISTIADNESSATAYTVAGSTVETITTLGTYAAPTATKCRFKEVDSTNHKGVYEFQFADARFAVSSAKSLLISALGASNLAQADFVVQLLSDDPYVAKPANFASFSVDGSGRVDVGKHLGQAITLDANNVLNVSTKYVGGTLQTAGDIVSAVSAVQADLPQRITKNVALSAFPFFMADSTDHVSGKTGLTVTAQRSIDGGAFGACANSAVEVSNGWYKIDLSAADLNGNTIALKFTATGADATNVTVITEPT